MDKNAVCKNDITLMTDLFGNLDAKTLPVSFKIGDVTYEGIPEEFSPKARKRFIDSNITETIIEGINDKGIKLRAEILEYRDFPVVEWQLTFENTSKKTTKIISELNAINTVFPAKKAVLHHGNGETRNEEGFHFFDTKIGKEPVVISPVSSTSCEGAFPYMRIYTEGYTASIAIGWPGGWQASVAKVTKGVRYTAGQKRFATKMLPGEVFISPKITVMLTDGDDKNRAMNMWRRWYFAHILPKEYGKNIPPKACMHVYKYNGPEFTGATTESQLEGLEKYVERGLKPDIWWIDAGWYKCEKGWPVTGTWEVDTDRFPDRGLAPIGEACEKHGAGLLLWFEPERVHPGTWIEKEHPEWLLKDTINPPKGLWTWDSYLLDLGNEEALAWITEHVNTLIKKWHVKVYRQDFNLFFPNRVWEANEAKDRIGAIENKHIQGYLRYWDSIVFNNPGLWIDSCAAGGRRNDLETMRRAVPLHYTDVGYGNHPIKQIQHQQHFEWIPYFRAHTNSWDNEEGTYNPRVLHDVVDEFAYQNCMTPAITVTTPAWAEEDEFATGRKMLPVWRRAAELELRADYYPITQSTASATDLYAVEFSDPIRGDGMIHVIRNTLCEKSSVTAQLHTCPCSNYVLENPVTGEIRTVTGESLANGFTVELEKRSGEIWFYRRTAK